MPRQLTSTFLFFVICICATLWHDGMSHLNSDWSIMTSHLLSYHNSLYECCCIRMQTYVLIMLEGKDPLKLWRLINLACWSEESFHEDSFHEESLHEDLKPSLEAHRWCLHEYRSWRLARYAVSQHGSGADGSNVRCGWHDMSLYSCGYLGILLLIRWMRLQYWWVTRHQFTKYVVHCHLPIYICRCLTSIGVTCGAFLMHTNCDRCDVSKLEDAGQDLDKCGWISWLQNKNQILSQLLNTIDPESNISKTHVLNSMIEFMVWAQIAQQNIAKKLNTYCWLFPAANKCKLAQLCTVARESLSLPFEMHKLLVAKQKLQEFFLKRCVTWAPTTHETELSNENPENYMRSSFDIHVTWKMQGRISSEIAGGPFTK